MDTVSEFLIGKVGLFGMFFVYYLVSALICNVVMFVVNYLATKYIIYSLKKQISNGTLKVVPMSDFDDLNKDTRWN